MSSLDKLKTISEALSGNTKKFGELDTMLDKPPSKFVDFMMYGSLTETPETQSWMDVIWVDDLDIFVATGSSGTDRITTSPDGVTWTYHNVPARNYANVCWSPELSLLVAVSWTSSHAITSPDGVTWTDVDHGLGPYRGIDWSPELGIFCAVPKSSGPSMISSDGVNWSHGETSFPSGNQRLIRWSSSQGKFVTTAYDSQEPRIVKSGISTNGVDWEFVDAPSAIGLVWVESRGIWVSCALGDVSWSEDAVNWTTNHSDIIHLGVTYSPDLDIFVAPHYYGVSYSRDLVNWSKATEHNSRYWNEAAYSPKLGVVVCMPLSSTKIYTSRRIDLG